MSITRLTRTKWLFLVLTLIAIGVGLVLLLGHGESQKAEKPPNSAKKSSTKKKAEVKLPVINLQPTVNAWAASQRGSASVVVVDLANKKVVASLKPNQEYFTASLYKLYVAYEGYLTVQNGTYSMADPYLSGYNRGQCLDAMIRNSYSPCGEKMWNELGKQNLTSQLKKYGITHTSLTALTTSAHDTATILQRLFERRDLHEKYTLAYLDSMKTQPALYRRGLPSGFKKSVVYNKVGWNGQVEWHDGAIVKLPNGRSYVVVVLTESVGSRNVVELGRLLEAKLL